MNGIILGGMIFFALMFGGIAVWAGLYIIRDSNKPAPRPRPRPGTRAKTADPWDIEQLRRGQRAAQ
jgi:hypothetical protein